MPAIACAHEENRQTPENLSAKGDPKEALEAEADHAPFPGRIAALARS
jgi:hypothetical protein